MSVTLRAANAADLSAIVEIYNEAGIGTTASYDLEPVDLADRQAWFERLRGRGFPVVVAEGDDGVVAYGCYGPFRDKAGYAHTVEHSVYVAGGHRASGAGRLVMEELIRLAREDDVHVLVGILDADNEASRRFHLKLGCTESARLPQVGRKFGRWLDVSFMTLTLS